MKKHLLQGIGKKMQAAAQQYSALQPWVQHIVRHFWTACQECQGSEDRFKVII